MSLLVLLCTSLAKLPLFLNGAVGIVGIGADGISTIMYWYRYIEIEMCDLCD